MKPEKHQIVIIGGGTAGITVAARLKNEKPKLDVVIVDPAEYHYYQPAFTLVGAGTFNYEKTRRPMRSVIPKGVTWIPEYVDKIEPDENRIQLRDGRVLEYDYLVVCPGIQIDLDAIPGLKESLGTRNITSIYVDPNYTWEVIRNFKGGTALFTQPATPIKCGGAPQKIMYLADDYFRKTGVRDKSTIVFATPGSVIFGTEPFKQTLEKVVDRKDLYLRFFHKLTRIDPENKIAYYEIMKHHDEPEKLVHNPKPIGLQVISEKEVAIPFDMLHLAPPQSAPDFVKKSPLANEAGWLDVDIHSLQHKSYPNVFGLGDAAGLPTAKTGAAVRKQAPVVVHNILSLLAGKPVSDTSYNGYSSCPLVTGYGRMVLAEFDYDNKRASDPLISTFVDTSKEQYSMWLLKKYGLPFMYWNLMLKGRA
ncbi:MAG: NAD(P)/FAD-dependent oxidoreductase [Bacteroidetes bacterium]|nr:MAG: NAD(P)/FAD-dependent oxidoreductase [Bacteroidota bacterium]